MKAYDYIIAGGGSAGCVLAARLSAGSANVLLIEAGPTDSHPFIHIPAGFTKLSGPKVNWATALSRKSASTIVKCGTLKVAPLAAAVRSTR